MIAQAFRIIHDEAGLIPLHQQSLVWGVSKKVKIVQRADNQNAYVKRIMINEFSRSWQRYRALPVGARTDHPEVAVPDVSNEVVNRTDLLRALLTLPARQRATVVLRYLEGMSVQETAAVMRCREGTVKSQAARALSTLGDCLNYKELPT